MNPVQQDEKKLGLKRSLVPSNKGLSIFSAESLNCPSRFPRLKETSVWAARQLFVAVQREGDLGD